MPYTVSFFKIFLLNDLLTLCSLVVGGCSDDYSSTSKAPNVKSRFSRSSGRRPFSTEEANRSEANTRMKKPAKPEPTIIISDDEFEGSLPSSAPPPPLQPWPKPGFPDPSSIGRGWRPQVNLDGPLPRIQPIAEIAPGQKSAVPDSSSVMGLLQLLENGLKQAISIIEVRWATFMVFCPFILSILEEIQRVGGPQLANRCEQKLTSWLTLAYRVEDLAFFESCDEVIRLVDEARIKASRERVFRERKISEQEIIFSNSYERQRRLQRKINLYHTHVERTGIRTVQGEKTLKDFTRECTRVQDVTEREKQVLEAMRREHAAAIAANSEEELEKEAKARVRAIQEEKLAAVKADLASFTLLDCANEV